MNYRAFSFPLLHVPGTGGCLLSFKRLPYAKIYCEHVWVITIRRKQTKYSKVYIEALYLFL